VISLWFGYGQRHRLKLLAPADVASGLKLNEQHTIVVNLTSSGHTALTL